MSPTRDEIRAQQEWEREKRRVRNHIIGPELESYAAGLTAAPGEGIAQAEETSSALALRESERDYLRRIENLDRELRRLRAVHGSLVARRLAAERAEREAKERQAKADRVAEAKARLRRYAADDDRAYLYAGENGLANDIALLLEEVDRGS